MARVLTITPARDGANLTRFAELLQPLFPHMRAPRQNLEWMLDKLPHAEFGVAELEGEPVGVTFTAVFPGVNDDSSASGTFGVLPEYRRRGIGTALYEHVAGQARAAGRDELILIVYDNEPEGIAFARKLGFTEIEHQKTVALDLTELEPEEPRPPEGVVIVSRQGREDLIEQAYEVVRDARRDVPGLEGESEVTYEEWRNFEIDMPTRLPELFMIALAGDEVVGVASSGASDGEGSHGFTAVKSSWRRRGVARALKLAVIRAAKDAGLRKLRTNNEERNEPMRRLNEELGYRPEPGQIGFRGPIG